uniref:BRCT domain-containing protein n=1 Tax=Panagrolaimus davidi TaxID=227884 RepID=A0A914P2R9_9BILA
MEQKTCTHLLLDSKDGEKYRKAVEWKTVKIVTLKWLMKCVEDGIRYEEDKYHPGVIPSTQMLVRDDSFFDADSADPFHHLSNQNLFGEIKAKNVQETNILPSKNDNNGKSAEEEATVSEDNGDKSEKQNVEPMDIDRPVLEDDQQAVVAENEKSNQVEPVKEATKASTSKQDMDDDDDSFTKTWSEVPIAKSQQQKVTKVKPRRRIFGIYEESEEGTDDSEANRSAAILSRVRPKPKRRLPAPEPEANSDDSIQIAEEAAPSPPQPTDNSDALNAQPTEAIDTKELCKQIQDELVRLGISQTVFAVKVADRSQKTVSETLKNPKAWEKLGKKGQYIYIRMYNWIKFSEQRRLSHFQNNEIKNYKQIGIDSEAVIQVIFKIVYK